LKKNIILGLPPFHFRIPGHFKFYARSTWDRLFG